MFGIYEDEKGGIFIVMEFMEQGSLDQLIEDKFDSLTVENISDFAHQGNRNFNFSFMKKKYQ